jgi:N-acetylneuraminic acid mutarotase
MTFSGLLSRFSGAALLEPRGQLLTRGRLLPLMGKAPAQFPPRSNWSSGLLLAVFLLVQLVNAQAQVPGLLSYQGKVLVSGSPFNGNGKFKFALLSAGGAQVYWGSAPDNNSDGQPDTNVLVAVNQGVFAVLLGDTNLPNMAPLPPSVFTNASLFLRIWFDDGSHGQQQLSPDQPIASAGYAMMAANIADGAITPSKLAPGTSLSVTSAISTRLDGLTSLVTSLSNQMSASITSGLTVVSSDPQDATLSAKGFVEYSVLAAPPWFISTAPGAPSSRSAPAGVWTGQELLIWGGNVGLGIDSASGGRYRPDLDQWQDISTVNPPAARQQHCAVWSGQEMLVWGGISSNAYVNAGGRFNPTSQLWTAMSLSNAPAGRKGFVAVWAGSQLVVVGGQNGSGLLADAALYDPVADQWTTLVLSNAPAARSLATAVWTGTRLLVWGGQNELGALNTGVQLIFNGAALPSAWTTINTKGAPTARMNHAAVWTGQKMLIWGGVSGGTFLGDGAAYDPVANLWSRVNLTNSPNPRGSAAAVWTGQEMLIFGGETASGTVSSSAAYDPAADKWRLLSNSGSPLASSGATSAWTGSALLVFGGLQNGQSLGFLQSVSPQPTWYLYRKP